MKSHLIENRDSRLAQTMIEKLLPFMTSTTNNCLHVNDYLYSYSYNIYSFSYTHSISD